MTSDPDFGVRLADGMVAPAASEQLASDSARLLCRSLCVLRASGWRVAALRLPASWSPRLPRLGVGCSDPGFRTVRRHQRHGEPLCGPCRAFERQRGRAGYARARARSAVPA